MCEHSDKGFFYFAYLVSEIQVLFRRVWFCKPLTEAEFSDAIKGHCLQPQRSFFGISYQQVRCFLCVM
jgi:hypothetical protein